MSATVPKVRDQAIDALKGILVILVVLAHNNGSHPFFLVFCHPAMMGMFFMVSGYLIAGRKELDLGKRLKGILLQLLFFVAFSVAWRFAYGYISHEPLDVGRWTDELLKGENWSLNIPLWYLIAYAQTLVLKCFVDKIANSLFRWSVLIVLMLAGFAMMHNHFNPMYFARSLQYLPFLCLGGELRHTTVKFQWGGYPIATLLLLVGVLFIRCRYAPTDYALQWAVDTVIAMPLALLCYNLFKCKWVPTKVLAYYGHHSIVVLCVHILLLDIVWRIWFAKFGLPGMRGALIQTLIVCLLLYPCCEVYSRYIQPRLK